MFPRSAREHTVMTLCVASVVQLRSQDETQGVQAARSHAPLGDEDESEEEEAA